MAPTADKWAAGGLTVERSTAGWATVAFNRPDKHNALSIGLRQALHEAVNELDQDPDIHVLILTANGRIFTAGLDLDEWETTAEPAAAAYQWDAVDALRQFKGPVIAAVNGPAITGGLEIVLACDLIIASDQASFADTHVRVGLLPGWGGSVRLIQRLGLHRAKEMAFTARTLSAHEALAWGLVNHVVPHDELLQRAQAVALEMLKADPHHLLAYKALLDDESQSTFAQALELEHARSLSSNSSVRATDIRTRLKSLLG